MLPPPAVDRPQSYSGPDKGSSDKPVYCNNPDWDFHWSDSWSYKDIDCRHFTAHEVPRAPAPASPGASLVEGSVKHCRRAGE